MHVYEASDMHIHKYINVWVLKASAPSKCPNVRTLRAHYIRPNDRCAGIGGTVDSSGQKSARRPKRHRKTFVEQYAKD